MTKSVERTWKSMVVAADPDFEHEKRKHREYTFSRKGVTRDFYGDQARRGPYAEDE